MTETRTAAASAVGSHRRSAAWFLVPSLIGLALFVVPLPAGEDGVSIPIALIAGALQDVLAPALPWIAVAVMAVSVLGVLVVALTKPDLSARPMVRSLFDVGPVWTVVRVVGLVLGVMTALRIGPEALVGEDTGGLIMDLVTLMVTVFLIAGLLLPLLLDFGLLEFAGALMRKVMRPLFTVPGRASVSSLAAWLGDGSIGVLMTGQQYQAGHFTRREAAVLGTTFNVVSVTFTIVIVGQLSLQHMFGPFYLTIVVAGLVAAVIMPRIPPLSLFPDERFPGAPQVENEDDTAASDPRPPLSRAWHAARRRADEVGVREVARTAASNVLEMWLGILPVIMAIGTAAVLVAEHTPLFTWLGAPFIPVLELMGVPEAEAASQALFIGFADMLLPAVIVSDVTAEMTRFVIGALSVSQLIYMSEVGGLLLGSAIPVRFHHLVSIFLLRTVICLPVIVGMAHLLY